MKKRIISILKLIVINYSIFITAIVTIEIIGQIRHYTKHGYFIFEKKPMDVIFEDHPYLSGVPIKNKIVKNYDGSKSITIDSLGYRFTGCEFKGSKNVILIGGSTTFCTGVSDNESWPYLLQEKLGEDYNVYNLGVPGYCTAEAIIQLALIVPNLNPDFIVNYQGWNDIRNYHDKNFTYDYSICGKNQKTNLRIKTKEKRFIENFYWFNLVKKFKTANKIKIQFEKFNVSDPKVDSAYARNLKKVYALSNDLKSKNIYVNQILNMDSLIMVNENITDLWTPTINLNRLPQLMQSFNSIMNKTIIENHNNILLDSVQQKINWNKKDFVDFGHFSKKGNEKFSDYIYKEIIQL